MTKKYINKYPVTLWGSFSNSEFSHSSQDQHERVIPENTTWFLKGVTERDLVFKLRDETCARVISLEIFDFSFVEVDEEQAND